MRPIRVIVASLALALLGAACGSDDNASGTDPGSEPARALEIEMKDNE